MKMSHTTYRQIHIVLNIYIGFQAILLLVVLTAPLFGGVFLPRGLLGHGSIIGFVLIGKYQLKISEQKRIITKWKFLGIVAYDVAFLFLLLPWWIALPIIIICVPMMVIGRNAQKRSSDFTDS